MDDLIRRQAVIDTIEDDVRNGTFSCFASYDDAQRFKKYIKKIDSAPQRVEPTDEYEIVKEYCDSRCLTLIDSVYLQYLSNDTISLCKQQWTNILDKIKAEIDQYLFQNEFGSEYRKEISQIIDKYNESEER